MKNAVDIYGGRDPHDRPVYPPRYAGRILDIPESTIRAWTRGQKHFEQLLTLPDPEDGRLSFNNLIEVFILRSLRETKGVPMQSIREAIDAARDYLGIERVLLHEQFRVAGQDLFLDKLSSLESLSPPDQYAMRRFLEQYLERIEWKDVEMPDWLKPFSRVPGLRQRSLIAINPKIRFGRPIIRRRGVSTGAIYDLYMASESKAAVKREFDITDAEFEEAIIFERAA